MFNKKVRESTFEERNPLISLAARHHDISTAIPAAVEIIEVQPFELYSPSDGTEIFRLPSAISEKYGEEAGIYASARRESRRTNEKIQTSETDGKNIVRRDM